MRGSPRVMQKSNSQQRIVCTSRQQVTSELYAQWTTHVVAQALDAMDADVSALEVAVQAPKVWAELDHEHYRLSRPEHKSNFLADAPSWRG